MGKRKAKSQRPKSGQNIDPETAIWVQHTEERLKDTLGPFETQIMTVQSILVWEKPWYSLAMLVCVNVLFWLATRMRFYYLMGMTGMVVVFVDVWISAIWPEIRGPPAPNDDSEGWTPVHPKLLSVPELCRPLAEYWVLTSKYLHWLIHLRVSSPAKFFLLMMSIFIALAIFGSYTSGLTLAYTIVMAILFVPAMKYHSVTQKMYEKIEPTLYKVEDSLKIRRKKSRKGKKKRGEEPGEQYTDSDSDADLQEFVPEQDPKFTKVLSKASNHRNQEEEEEEEEEGGLTAGLLIPESISQGPSREHTDTEHEEEEGSFTRGLSIPAFDDSRLDDSFSSSFSNGREQEQDKGTPEDVLDLNQDEEEGHLDDSSDELNTTAIKQDLTFTSPAEGGESIQFVSTHFKESDSELEDESHLAQGLDFPDIEEALQEEEKEKTALEKAAAALASETVTKTVGSLMVSTMSGLNKIGETVRAAASSIVPASENTKAAAEVEYSKQGEITGPEQEEERSKETVTIKSPPPTEDASGGGESTDADILAEFEFLEQAELEALETGGPTDEDMKK